MKPIPFVTSLIRTLPLALLLATPVRAETIIQSEAYSFYSSGSQILTFDLFDTSQGDLTAVSFNVTLFKTGGRLAVDNDDDSAVTFNIVHSVSVSLTNSLGVLSMLTPTLDTVAAGLLAETSTQVSLDPTTGDDTQNFNATGAGDYFNLNPYPSASDSSSDSVHTTLGVPSYEGTGTFEVEVDGSDGFNLGSEGNISFSGSNDTVVSGVVQITYHFNPSQIPEPSISKLFVLSGIALYLLRKSDMGRKA